MFLLLLLVQRFNIFSEPHVVWVFVVIERFWPGCMVWTFTDLFYFRKW